ncbi:MAG: hypothetical protein GF308_15680 [Candidatus Heimdallarchaeota archaeon]|nr:hypothetical protein [Candidatus Heimdallarchaeota archaeon]
MTKKINPKIASIALLLLTFLAAGGIAIKECHGPQGGGSGFEPDYGNSGGG